MQFSKTWAHQKNVKVFSLTAIVGPHSFVVAHLKGVQDGRDVDVDAGIWSAAEKLKKTLVKNDSFSCILDSTQK